MHSANVKRFNACISGSPGRPGPVWIFYPTPVCTRLQPAHPPAPRLCILKSCHGGSSRMNGLRRCAQDPATHPVPKLMIDAPDRKSNTSSGNHGKPGTAAPHNRFAERSPEECLRCSGPPQQPTAPTATTHIPMVVWLSGSNCRPTPHHGVGKVWEWAAPRHTTASPPVHRRPIQEQVFRSGGRRQGQDKWPLQGSAPSLQLPNKMQTRVYSLALREQCRCSSNVVVAMCCVLCAEADGGYTGMN